MIHHSFYVIKWLLFKKYILHLLQSARKRKKSIGNIMRERIYFSKMYLHGLCEMSQLAIIQMIQFTYISCYRKLYFYQLTSHALRVIFVLGFYKSIHSLLQECLQPINKPLLEILIRVKFELIYNFLKYTTYGQNSVGKAVQDEIVLKLARYRHFSFLYILLLFCV